MTPHWIVDDYILESRSVVGDLLGAIRDSGATLYQTKYVPFAEQQDYGSIDLNRPNILYGTHGFVSKCPHQFTPGAYGITSHMDLNQYLNYIPDEWMFNNDIMFLPWGVFKQRLQTLFESTDFGALFIRPNSGFKTFPGQVITFDNQDDVIKTLEAHSSVMDHTWIGFCEAKAISGEFRFLIVDGKVVDGSGYRWDDISDVRHDWPGSAWDLAKKVASLSWRPDTAFMCDVAMWDEHNPQVLEINSFACAGLYAMDKKLVVNAINELALREFSE